MYVEVMCTANCEGFYGTPSAQILTCTATKIYVYIRSTHPYLLHCYILAWQPSVGWLFDITSTVVDAHRAECCSTKYETILKSIYTQAKMMANPPTYLQLKNVLLKTKLGRMYHDFHMYTWPKNLFNFI